MSTPVPPCAAAIAGATSPSRIRFTFAPASRSSAISSLCRSRSSTTTETSRGVTPFAFATALTFSVGDASMSIDVDPVRADGDLLHVHGRAREEHRAALGDRDHRDRVRLPERRQARSLERVDRDVDRGCRCRRRRARRCRASAPRPSRPRRSRRRRPSRPCRASRASRRPPPGRRRSCRPGRSSVRRPSPPPRSRARGRARGCGRGACSCASAAPRRVPRAGSYSVTLRRKPTRTAYARCLCGETSRFQPWSAPSNSTSCASVDAALRERAARVLLRRGSGSLREPMMSSGTLDRGIAASAFSRAFPSSSSPESDATPLISEPSSGAAASAVDAAVGRADERDLLRTAVLQLVDGAAHVRDGAARAAVRAAAREAERAQVDEQHVEAALRRAPRRTAPSRRGRRATRAAARRRARRFPARRRRASSRPTALNQSGPASPRAPSRSVSRSPAAAAPSRGPRSSPPQPASSSTRDEQEALHIRSGASTPIRSRQRAITCCVARQSARRKSRCSLSSTRCSW